MKKIICPAVIALISYLIGYKLYKKKTKYIKVNLNTNKNPYNCINKKSSIIFYHIIDTITSNFKKFKDFKIYGSKNIKPKCVDPNNCKKCIFKIECYGIEEDID